MDANIASLARAAASRNATAPRSAPVATKPERAKLEWFNVAPDELPPEGRDAYLAIKRASDAFDKFLQQYLDPPDHLRVVWSDRRGLAIALAPRAAPNVLSLADLMSRLNGKV